MTAIAPIQRHQIGPPEVHNALYLLDFAYADAAGHQVQPDLGVACSSPGPQCFHAQGVFGAMEIYQPSSREAEFQWVEGGLALGLAAGVGSLALWRLRRR